MRQGGVPLSVHQQAMPEVYTFREGEQARHLLAIAITQGRTRYRITGKSVGLHRHYG